MLSSQPASPGQQQQALRMILHSIWTSVSYSPITISVACLLIGLMFAVSLVRTFGLGSREPARIADPIEFLPVGNG